MRHLSIDLVLDENRNLLLRLYYTMMQLLVDDNLCIHCTLLGNDIKISYSA